MASSRAAPSPAVAGPPFPLEVLKGFEAEQGFRQIWRTNNTALKYFRSQGEDPPGVAQVSGSFEFDLWQVYQIGVSEYSVCPVRYSFATPAVAGKMQKWSPVQFVTHLRSYDIRTMGLEEHGVQKLECVCWPNTLDEKLKNAMVQAGTPYPEGVDPPHVGFRPHPW